LASLEVCTLLSKQIPRDIQIEPKYIGFEIPNRFVVGYGLDYAERYREVPDIRCLD
jgi:hypoxanthine phosphoribosyltransferase